MNEDQDFHNYYFLKILYQIKKARAGIAIYLSSLPYWITIVSTLSQKKYPRATRILHQSVAQRNVVMIKGLILIRNIPAGIEIR